MQTRDQKYGAAIYKQINENVAGTRDDYKNSYGSMAHKLPVLIRLAGLAQALGFVEARGKEAHKDLLDHLAVIVLSNDAAKGSELSQQTRETKQLSEYMRLTHEVMAALAWYKRFAQSVLDVDASEASTEQLEDN